MNHTPGPWYVGHDAVNPMTGDATLSVGPIAHTVAAVIAEDDARLIAAAPELLGALTRFTEWAERASGTFTMADIQGIVTDAHEAIRKAEGHA